MTQVRIPPTWSGRYVLADGRPRAFTVDAWNKADAAAKVEQLARAALGEAFRAALWYGIERAVKSGRL